MPEILVIETDPVVEYVVTDSPGGGISAPDLYGNDSDVVTTLGDQSIVLTHTPVAESVIVFWRGVRLRPTAWTLSWRDLVIADAEHLAAVGDTFTVYYRWRAAEQAVIPDITVDVPLTRGRLVRHEADGSTTDVDLDMPADGPVAFELNASSTADSLQATSFYPLEYAGLDAAGDDYVPATPAGYELAGTRPFVKAYVVGGAQEPITDDVSGLGYEPEPTVSPFLQVSDTDHLTFGVLPTTEPTDRIVCAVESTVAGFTAPLVVSKWYSTTPPPWLTDPRTIRVTEYGWRFVFTPIGGA